MAWSAAISEGFLLAATLASDRHAQMGRTGLSGAASASMAALVSELTALEDTQRRQRIQDISRRMARTLVSPCVPMPPRALAILAPVSERRLGQTWLANAPPPRPGYRVEPGLRCVLMKIAESGRWRG
jgi:hypothetical protein